MRLDIKDLFALLILGGYTWAFTTFLIPDIWEIEINQSKSLPYKVFLTVKKHPFKKGDIVSVRGHETAYMKNCTFTKIVIGVPGDEIQPLMGKVIERTSSGLPLTPLKTPKVIPEGYYFLSGTHPRSYDSRYQEFGLVKAQHILGKSFPLW